MECERKSATIFLLNRTQVLKFIHKRRRMHIFTTMAPRTRSYKRYHLRSSVRSTCTQVKFEWRKFHMHGYPNYEKLCIIFGGSNATDALSMDSKAVHKFFLISAHNCLFIYFVQLA